MDYTKQSLLVSIVLFLSFLIIAVTRTYFNSINLEVNIWASTINRNVLFTQAALGISTVLDTNVLDAFSVVISIVLVAKNRWKYGVLLLFSMSWEAILVSVFKTVVASPRPANQILSESSYSFPSGHVTGAVVFFGILTYLVWSEWKSFRPRILASLTCALVIGIVGFDRIYLNVHWFTDVIGALFLGFSLLSLAIYVFIWQSSKNPSSRRIPKGLKQRAIHT